MKKNFLLIILGLGFLIFLFLKWVDVSFARKIFQPAFSPSPQFWSHRGLGGKNQANTMEAFGEALSKGAQGIEIDVFFDEQKRSFVVSHDYPYQLYYGAVQFLPDFFLRFRDSTQYWIDLKNLTVSNASLVSAELNKWIDSLHIRRRVFVESAVASALKKLSSQGIRTLYWVQFNRTNPILRWLKLHYLKYQILQSHFDGITSSCEFYDDDFRENFGALPVFLFHPADSAEIRKYAEFPATAVILTDGLYGNQLKP